MTNYENTPLDKPIDMIAQINNLAWSEFQYTDRSDDQPRAAFVLPKLEISTIEETADEAESNVEDTELHPIAAFETELETSAQLKRQIQAAKDLRFFLSTITIRTPGIGSKGVSLADLDKVRAASPLEQKQLNFLKENFHAIVQMNNGEPNARNCDPNLISDRSLEILELSVAPKSLKSLIYEEQSMRHETLAGRARWTGLIGGGLLGWAASDYIYDGFFVRRVNDTVRNYFEQRSKQATDLLGRFEPQTRMQNTN